MIRHVHVYTNYEVAFMSEACVVKKYRVSAQTRFQFFPASAPAHKLDLHATSHRRGRAHCGEGRLLRPRLGGTRREGSEGPRPFLGSARPPRRGHRRCGAACRFAPLSTVGAVAGDRAAGGSFVAADVGAACSVAGGIGCW